MIIFIKYLPINKYTYTYDYVKTAAVKPFGPYGKIPNLNSSNK
jgi:hypothetical protein